MLAVASIIGETIALVVCEYTLRRRHGERAGPWWTTVVAVVLMVFASAVSWFSHAWFGPWIGLAVSLLVCAGTIGLALVLSSRFRAACRNLVKVLSRRGGGGSRGSKAGSAAGELPAD
jgi:drug/metabolite transporter (DMT)-like permease